MSIKTVYKKTSSSQIDDPSVSLSPEQPQLVSKKIIENIKTELHRIKPLPHGFHAFPDRKKISFDTQENKEKILVLMRAHIITNLSWVLGVIIFIVFSLVIFVYTPFLTLLPSVYNIFGVILWLLFILAFIVEKSLSWYFNVYIITDERVIDVDFYSLTAKRISEAKIDKIEDVSYSQGGLLQSFFDYGTVNIQTAGEKTEFEFENIPCPARIASILNQLMLHEEQEKIEGRIS